jgi:hypothetical protein
VINPGRPKVYWLGPEPGEDFKTEFQHRAFVVEVSRDFTRIREDLPFVRAVVLRFNAQKPGALQEDLRVLGASAVDHGAAVFMLADDHTEQFHIREAIRVVAPTYATDSRTGPAGFEIAEAIGNHDPGLSYRPDLEVEGTGTELLQGSAQILLHRAFSDCKSIRIEGLTGGKSANVFCVYATFRDSLVGPRPLPFFAKIDRKDKILEELQNYTTFADHFVPFNLRPNLHEQRCLIGASEGILVGNFVEHSEPLWDVVKRGAAQESIHSLFDHALRGWRLQAYEGYSQVQSGPLITSLGNVFDPGRVSQNRRKVAKELGGNLSPEQVYEKLQKQPLSAYRVAPIHGDLNAQNVRVRGTDAILIDFAKTRTGPIVADPAALEVNLAFTIASESDDNEGWRKLIDRLYRRAYLRQPPPPAAQPLPREWLWTCVRQIRMVALSMETTAGEYRDAVVAYLLRFAMFAAESAKEEHRRAYAMVIAERLLEEPDAESST